MAFNNRPSHSQMPGAFADAERDEDGYTAEDYIQIMDDFASKYKTPPDMVGSTVIRCSYHR